jgi:hypothetical protein
MTWVWLSIIVVLVGAKLNAEMDSVEWHYAEAGATLPTEPEKVSMMADDCTSEKYRHFAIPEESSGE